MPRGTGYVKGFPVHHDEVTVHPSSLPVIEISSRAPEHRDKVLKAFAELFSCVPADFVARAFDRPGQWKDLKAKLGSHISGHEGNRRGNKEPAAYSMHARRGERLDDLPKWQVLGLNHEDARELTFFFWLPFALDGYPELVLYYLQTQTGQIKFADDVSEFARARVIDEYLTIAR